MTMDRPAKGKPYAVTVRHAVIALAREGRPIRCLSKEYGPTPRTIRQWLYEAGIRTSSRNTTKPPVTVPIVAQAEPDRAYHMRQFRMHIARAMAHLAEADL